MLNSLPARTLGRSGIATAALGLGCWAIGGPTTNLGMPIGWSNADDDASMAGLRLAYQRGIGVFDTADVYGHGRSERLIGRLVREVDRDSVVLVSKVGYFSPDERHRFDPINIRRQIQTTLSNLGTDHLDIYFLHNEGFGDDAYLEPAITTLRALRDEGLVRAVGMRGPHRFAVDRLHATGDRRGDKIARFRYLFDLINPGRHRCTGQPAHPGGPVARHLRLGRHPRLRGPGQQAPQPGVAHRHVPTRRPAGVRRRRPPCPQALVRPAGGGDPARRHHRAARHRG